MELNPTLIPEWPMWVLAILLIGLFAIVVKSSDIIVDTASEISQRFGVSELLVGLTIVAFGTSAPEFAVTMFASLDGANGIALGNVIGSNIFNVGIILALFAIVKPVSVSRELFFRDCSYFLMAVCLLTFACYTDNGLTRVEGGFFFSLLLAYVGILFLKNRRAQQAGEQKKPESLFSKANLTAVFKLCIGLALLLTSSKGIVEIAIRIARDFQLSEWLIGTTLVAAGTSLPELATALSSIAKKKYDIGVGNIIGSELFNILGVIGLASLITPISGIDQMQPLYLMLAMTVFVVIAMRTHWVLSRAEGIMLVCFAIVRWGFAAQ